MDNKYITRTLEFVS